MEKVFVLKTGDRAEAIPRLFAQFDLRDFKGKKIALKANCNSADPLPASTHLETLSAIVNEWKNAGAAELGVGVHSAQDIQLVPLNGESEKFVKGIENILKTEG